MSQNKELQKASARRHYQKNKPAMVQRARVFNDQARKRNRDFIRETKMSSQCADCGISDHRVLQFHHLGEKEVNVADAAINRIWSLKRLQAEIGKCIVICANCHSIRHYNEQ